MMRDDSEHPEPSVNGGLRTGAPNVASSEQRTAQDTAAGQQQAFDTGPADTRQESLSLIHTSFHPFCDFR
ncbi:unnamed protein product [Gongylonema pulchrum]|uniref:Uncharacterized protein n=1 Tax=Gongylonema pulchrum TaxID=637853 RepID=A0A183DV86_9BILA|nr:unnamed protein product [Gongylonema pulchrum]